MKACIKTPEEIEILREGGRRLARVLDAVERAVAPGISTKELDEIAEREIRVMGDEPAFLGYRPWDAARPYPASLCVSVNDEIVHGIPKKEKFLEEGDIVGIDLGIKHRGLFTDSARTVAAGNISEKARKLLEATERALSVGIAAARGGKNGKGACVGDIGATIEAFVRPLGYGIVRGLGGHGVGREIHEEPYIANHAHSGEPGARMKLKAGMVIAIEPMLTAGKAGMVLDADGYTYRTKDRSLAAHFEHTILITNGAPEILTR